MGGNPEVGQYTVKPFLQPVPEDFIVVRCGEDEIMYEAEISAYQRQARVVYPVSECINVTIEGDDVTVFI